MSLSAERAEYCDSLSCLHALEHFGLGRYGDPIDPQGFVRGLANMARLLKPGGVFYLSTPIGAERVEFSANRVFEPRAVVESAATQSLALESLIVIQSDGRLEEFAAAAAPLSQLATQRYCLGIFVFRKPAPDRRHFEQSE